MSQSRQKISKFGPNVPFTIYRRPNKFTHRSGKPLQCIYIKPSSQFPGLFKRKFSIVISGNFYTIRQKKIQIFLEYTIEISLMKIQALT